MFMSPSTVAVTDRSWISRYLSHRGDAGGEATAKPGEHDLDRRRAAVFGGEALGVIGVERRTALWVCSWPRPEKPSTVDRL